MVSASAAEKLQLCVKPNGCLVTGDLAADVTDDGCGPPTPSPAAHQPVASSSACSQRFPHTSRHGCCWCSNKQAATGQVCRVRRPQLPRLCTWLLCLAVLLLPWPGLGSSMAAATSPPIAQHSPGMLSPNLQSSDSIVPDITNAASPPAGINAPPRTLTPGDDYGDPTTPSPPGEDVSCSLELQSLEPGSNVEVAVPTIGSGIFPSGISFPASYAGEDCGCRSPPYNLVFGAEAELRRRSVRGCKCVRVGNYISLMQLISNL
ncbi:hypothetical protein Vafri_4906 [Volvox africanus]|uniref:Uncharacterized protein n=1 Tax=Volvox africanus TaxID=51714 RepID=A0A8J4EWD2_9CHLO|nr:hypothetical protein Vafri_4906 [Volvox africanus]